MKKRYKLSRERARSTILRYSEVNRRNRVSVDIPQARFNEMLESGQIKLDKGGFKLPSFPDVRISGNTTNRGSVAAISGTGLLSSKPYKQSIIITTKEGFICTGTISINKFK